MKILFYIFLSILAWPVIAMIATAIYEWSNNDDRFI